jgi:AcrR family transcriptional regulator
MYHGQVPRSASPAVRVALVEQAASMLARREPVTLRTLVGEVGASTMAVYTHFGGMQGLWRAVRQEGFTRLGERLSHVRLTEDPVRDLAALGSAYAGNALEHPHLYRVMFDAVVELDDPAAAARTFAVLPQCVARAQQAGRFDGAREPGAVATRLWASGHGLVTLVLTGVLPRDALAEHGPELVAAVCIAVGDDPEACRRSVRAGWEVPAL